MTVRARRTALGKMAFLFGSREALMLRVSPRSLRRIGSACVTAVVAVAAIVAGFHLIGQREWECSYRYWDNGGANHKAVVPTLLLVGGVIVGLVVTATSARAYLRSRRATTWLLPVALGLAPLVLVVLLLVINGNPMYDCSTG
jgi:hypothetical protein